MEYLSKQRYDEIAAELKHLIDVVYPKVKEDLATNTRMKFEIVSPHEMNLEAGKISLKSPIGAALMGKKVGEIAEAQVPLGASLREVLLHLGIDHVDKVLQLGRNLVVSLF